MRSQPRCPMLDLTNIQSLDTPLTSGKDGQTCRANPVDCAHPIRISSANGQHSNCAICGTFVSLVTQRAREEFQEDGLIAGIGEQERNCRLEISPSILLEKMKEKQGVNRASRVGVLEAESRRKLVDWMCEVGESVKLSAECVHKAMAYMDVIMSENKVAKQDVCAVAIICMLIAGKLSERDATISRIVALFKRQMANPRVDIMKYEVQILTLLHWDMQCVTALDFVQLFISQGIVFTNDVPFQPTPSLSQLARSARQFAEFFADLCLQQVQFLQVDPLHLSGGIIAAARKSLGMQRLWGRELELLTTLSFGEIEEVLRMIMREYEKLFPRPMEGERNKENVKPRMTVYYCPAVSSKQKRSGPSRS